MSTSTHTSVPRQIYPLASLNPYQGNWTIKVRVTSIGHMRHYNNTRGEGCVFSVELTDDDPQVEQSQYNGGGYYGYGQGYEIYGYAPVAQDSTTMYYGGYPGYGGYPQVQQPPQHPPHTQQPQQHQE